MQSGALCPNGGCAEYTTTGSAFAEAVRHSGEFTVAFTLEVTPEDLTDSQFVPLLVLGPSLADAGLAIGLEEGRLSVQMRDAAGGPTRSVILGRVQSSHQIEIAFRPGRVQAVIDGRLTKVSSDLTADAKTLPAAPLFIGGAPDHSSLAGRIGQLELSSRFEEATRR